MIKLKLLIFTFFAIFCSASFSSGDGPEVIEEKLSPNITNYKFKGSLESENSVGCVKLGNVKNTYTPADLYPASAKCVEEGLTETAVEIFFLAGAYSRYDALRIKDKSAGQARRVLIMNNFPPKDEDRKKEWDSATELLFNRDSDEYQDLCKRVAQNGFPEYYPKYMILH